MNFFFLLSYRYLFNLKKERTLTQMILICFMSVFISSFSLTLVMIIMNGFEKATYAAIKGLHAPLIIEAPSGDSLDFNSIKKVIEDEFPLISAVSPSSDCHLIITASDADTLHHIIVFRAINPLYEEQMHTITAMPLSSTAHLSSLIERDSIIIGYKLAQELGVKENETVYLLTPQQQHLNKGTVVFIKHPARVASIVKAGIDDIDASLALGSFDLLEKLFPGTGITQINVNLAANSKENIIAQQLNKRLGLTVYSWKEFYPALMSALLLEKYAMFFILALIALVACMNIASLLCMYITYKQRDIAILLAMGMKYLHARSIFVMIGMSISFFATIGGLVGAFIVGYYLEHYPFISLPETYYVSHLPAHMEWHIFLLSFLTILFISFLSSWLSTSNVPKMNISMVLRHEA